MAQQRVKGQDATLSILQGSSAIAGLLVKSFDCTLQMETQVEGYLGEQTDRRDDIYNGVEGSMSVHFDDPSVFDFLVAAVQRAKDKTSQVEFTLVCRVQFSSAVRTITIPDIRFGNLAINFGGRTEYGEIPIPFSAKDFTIE